ncbi:MAG: two pore domain potassium channel family protein [Actinomycetia bacterium]|nr:two pore domain potassium channel family protein [Actinomycetes bacterium]
MHVLATVVGVSLVGAVLADLVNTLVTTTTSNGRFWLTRILYTRTWTIVRAVGHRIRDDDRREKFLSTYAPVSVIALLVAWVAQQIVGFGLIWWGMGGLEGGKGLADSMYYSGVVFFTLGFGEIVPGGAVPRIGALVEAFAGVLTTALVIGYLPALYSAYSEREQKLLTLDDGTEGRITPTNLILSRAPTGDPRTLDRFFEEWEAWVAQVMETHTTFPMLSLFRSQHLGQHWITALGLVTDAALHMEMIDGCDGRAPYWMLRRSVRLMQQLTSGADLSSHRAALDADFDERVFRDLYDSMDDHGFPMKPYAEALAQGRDLRRRYDARLEYLIDLLEAPRGFWGHSIGHSIGPAVGRAPAD